jgi:hypothetical protein
MAMPKIALVYQPRKNLSTKRIYHPMKSLIQPTSGQDSRPKLAEASFG